MELIATLVYISAPIYRDTGCRGNARHHKLPKERRGSSNTKHARGLSPAILTQSSLTSLPRAEVDDGSRCVLLTRRLVFLSRARGSRMCLISPMLMANDAFAGAPAFFRIKSHLIECHCIIKRFLMHLNARAHTYIARAGLGARDAPSCCFGPLENKNKRVT